MEKTIFLKKFRKRNAIKQGDMASFLGVKQCFLSAIENTGRPLPDDKIDKIIFDGPKMGWNVSVLNPNYAKLTEAAASVSGEIMPDGTNPLGLDPVDVLNIRHGRSRITKDMAVEVFKHTSTINASWLIGTSDEKACSETQRSKFMLLEEMKDQLHTLEMTILSVKKIIKAEEDSVFKSEANDLITSENLVANGWAPDEKLNRTDVEAYAKTINMDGRTFHLCLSSGSNTVGRDWFLHVDNDRFETVGGADVSRHGQIDRLLALLSEP